MSSAFAAGVGLGFVVAAQVGPIWVFCARSVLRGGAAVGIAIGAGAAVIDGEEHAAPEGTFIRVEPRLSRTVRNEGDEPASVLIVSAPRRSGFEPVDWA